MHFWIDKRSQTCGFGRARVAASLSGTGLGFGHHPRRIGGKSMVTPVHRFQSVDCRPYVQRQSQSHHHNHQNLSQQQNSQQSHSQQSTHHHQQASAQQAHHNHHQTHQTAHATHQTHQAHHPTHQHYQSSPPRSQHYVCNLQMPSQQTQPHLSRHTEASATPHRDPAECNLLHQMYIILKYILHLLSFYCFYRYRSVLISDKLCFRFAFL